MTEEWRPVAGHEGYEVSDLGRVRSVDRVVIDSLGRRNRYKGRVLKGGVSKYRSVSLGYRTQYVHKLVADAFLGSRPDGLEVCHGNGDHLDNRLENLRYGTQSENLLDRVRHGTHHHAVKDECPSGHPYDEANTKVYRGKRYCRECHRIHSLNYYRRTRAVA